MIRKRIKYTLLAVALLLINSQVNAQLNIGGKPYSWDHRDEFQSPVVYQTLPALDMSRLDQEDAADEKNNVPPRFGYPHEVSLSPDNSGKWTYLADGSRVWRLGFSAPNALSINFLFEKYWLPVGATMYIYRPDQKDMIGGFTAQNNKSTRDDAQKFGTGLLYGDDVIIEVYEPAAVIGQSIISVSHVVHGYRYINVPESGFGTSGSCQVNVNCSPEGNNWQDEKKGVAMILVNGNRWCSGSLVNNTCRNADMLFLTANHCLDGLDAVSSPNANTWSFWWNYESPNCANPGSEPGHAVTNGATVIANNSASDFALLRLTESPLAQSPPADVYMNGWDRTTTPSSGGVGIHHPAGDVKKIATHTMVPRPNITFGGGPTGAPIANFWEVNWSATPNGHSVTEGGSSGSPIFAASNSLIIGQLWGGDNINCANPAQDEGVYGKIAVSWNGPSATRRLSDWLDPCGTNPTSLTGGYPYGCPGSLLVNYPITNTRYLQSGGSITASSTISSTASVTMQAANYIEMTNGFNATGGFLDAYIAPCNVTVQRQSNPEKQNKEASTDGNIAMETLVSKTGNIQLYPNPATDEIVISYNNTGCDKTSFTITDMRGAVIQAFSKDNTASRNSEQKTKVDVSAFAPGTYLVHIQCAAFRETTKFVVIP